jgi:hypothetical protein
MAPAVQAVASLSHRLHNRGVLKICPSCRRTFSGGRLCIHCENVALLDVAEPSVRRAHLREGELRGTIRTYYMARSAMLMAFMGILGGLAFAALFFRKAMLSDGPTRWVMVGLAAGSVIAGPIASAALGTRVVRLLTRTCRGRPIQLQDVHVVRNAPP